MSPVCDRCGQSNPAGARVCGVCGHVLGGDCGSAFASAACFVGRQQEIAALRWQLDEARRGRGSLALVSGEMGMGKTRLVKQFARSLAHPEQATLWGSCYEGDWHPPYGPWVEALRSQLPAIEQGQMLHALGPEAWSLAQLLPELRAAWPDLPAPAALGPEQERLRLYDAMTQVLLTLCQQTPLLLVLDDLHWADADSLRLLRHVGHSLGRMRAVLIVVYREAGDAARSSSLLQTITSLKHETNYREIVLGGLDRDHVSEYLAHTLGQEAPLGLTDALYQETNGNPFYLHEMVRHLLEVGGLEALAASSLAEIEMRGTSIPVGIQQIVRQRVAHLSETTHRVLHVAAACVRGWSLPLLQTLTELPEDVLLDSLDEALRAGFIQSREGTPPLYQLEHAIVRHTLYNEWNPDRRARLHRQVAQAMERVYAGREEEHAVELAAQYYASRTLPGADRGIRYAMAAAEMAGKMQGPRQAVTYLRMARELDAQRGDEAAGAEDARERAEILRRLAVAEAQALLWDAVPGTVDDALATICDAGGDSPTCASFLVDVVRALQEGGAPAHIWDPLIDRGLDLAGDKRDRLWARMALLRSCVEPLDNGPLRGGRWLGFDREAVAILRSSGDEDDYVRSLDPLARRTQKETGEILRFAERAGRPEAILGALHVALGDLVYWHGDLAGAAAVGERLLGAGERYGAIPAQAEAWTQLAGIRVLMGDRVGGRDAWQRAHELVARLGPEQPLRFMEIESGARLAYLGGGDWARLAGASLGHAMAPTATGAPFGLLAAATAALCYGQAGQDGQALSLLEWLTPLLAQAKSTTHLYPLTVTTAAASVWDLGASAQAQAHRGLALDLLEMGATVTVMGPADLAVARMAALCGDMAEADRHFARAREVAERAGQRPFRVLVDYDQAWALLRAGSFDAGRVAALLDVSLAGFQALGMPDWAQRAKRLSDEISALPLPTPRSVGQRHVARGPSYPDGLTAREVQVLALVADGMTNQEIADQLVLSIATVQRHVANIYNKINARNRSDATSYALRHKLLPTDSA